MQRMILTQTSVFAILMGTVSSAQDIPTHYTLFGTPGLLEMPSAHTAPDGTLAGTLAYQDGLLRATTSFQLTPKLSLSARYSIVDLYEDPVTSIEEDAFERSFDVHYRLNDETRYLPSVAIGMRDLFTPARFGAEYIVASKSIGDRLTVTGGLGWGALGLRDGFDNPFPDLSDRPTFDDAESEGELASDFWFQGDVAAFGGFTYQINDQWGLVAEYASNDYPETPGRPALKADSPYNFGISYRPRPNVQLSLASLYGSELALSGTFSLNANERPSMSGFEKAPAPIKARSEAELSEPSWDREALPPEALRSATAALLEVEGLTLHGLEVTETTARIRYSNSRYRSHAQAMGRVARMMTQVLPASIDTFIIETQARGIPLSSVTLSRRDLEQLENRAGAAATLLDRATFTDANERPPLQDSPNDDTRFAWGLGPYFTINPFVGDGGIAVDVGLSLSARYAITPQLVVSGAVTQSVLPPDKDDPSPNIDDVPNVRTDGGAYGDDGVPVLQRLTLSHFARPGPNLYSRVTVGYLERMFGGVSTELLWKPVRNRLGLGVELNYAVQRDSDMAFGFEEFDYDVVTGHVSAYYDLGNGYHTQLDVGRYLAGDWGATVSLDREYDNGIRIGAFVTQTDLSYDDFGDGSYNKGVRISIPQDFFTGSPNRSSYGTTIRTRVGDGGARLRVDGRLYGFVRDAHESDLTDTWGRFWR